MKKISLLLCLVLLMSGVYAGKKKEVVKDDRTWWCETAYKMAYPVLEDRKSVV